MTLLTAELIVECPRANLKVKVKEKCQGEPKCPHFKHFSYVGDKVYVVCSYGEKEEPKDRNIPFEALALTNLEQ